MDSTIRSSAPATPHSRTPVIVGAVIGSVALLVIAMLLVKLLRRRRSSRGVIAYYPRDSTVVTTPSISEPRMRITPYTYRLSILPSFLRRVATLTKGRHRPTADVESRAFPVVFTSNAESPPDTIRGSLIRSTRHTSGSRNSEHDAQMSRWSRSTEKSEPRSGPPSYESPPPSFRS